MPAVEISCDLPGTELHMLGLFVDGSNQRLASELVESPAGFLVLRKLGPTPAGFPRRTGVARKRPLG